MDGMTTMDATTPPIGAASAALAVKAQWYDTAMRKLRLSMQGLQWAELCAKSTRHYKSGAGLRGEGASDLVAWLHALDASPWLLPQPEAEAAILAAYAKTPAAPILAVGAAALSELPTLRVVKLDTLSKVQGWLQRAGPCVIEGEWTPSMENVRRDTEVLGPRGDEPGTDLLQHAVALVGFRPDAARLVNNKGVGWGALGRAWMPWETVAALLAEGGEAWGVLPVALAPKRGAK